MKTRIALSFALAAGMAFGQAQPKPKSQKEQEALIAIQNAPDPDARIAAIENLLTKFADTEYKVLVLQMAAASAQQKNDVEKMVIYSERTLEADPKSYPAMLMIAQALSTRTREFDLDKEEKLTKADKYAKEAIELVKTATKPRPDIPDAEWENIKKSYTAQGYEALGLSAMVRKKFDVAATNFQAAIDASPDASTMVRLAAAYNQSGQPDQAITVLDKINTLPEVHPAVKSAAAQERNTAVKLKGGAAKPAAPPTEPAK